VVLRRVVVVKVAAEEWLPMTLDRVALTRVLKAVTLLAENAAADVQRDSKNAFITFVWEFVM
jgi:hypothetical protein